MILTVDPSDVKTFTMTLPLPPKELHAHNTGHWRSKAGPTKKYRNLAYIECKAQQITPMPLAVLSIDFYWPNAKRRDILNACHGLKPAIDGIVDAGIIPDDDWKVLSIGHIRPHIDKTNPRVVLTLTSVDSKKNRP